MDCVFYTEPFWLFRPLNSGCQFEVSDQELLIVDEETWCPFHCPMADKQGQPTKKASWSEEDHLAVFNEIHRRREKALTQKKPFDLTGIVFPTDVNFEHVEFPPVSFLQATFSGVAAFQGATFNGEAIFSEATFRKEASFAQATFSEAAGFQEALFNRDANFYGATFTLTTGFHEATFSGKTTFSRATFSEEALFSQTRFRGAYVLFSDTTFVMDAGFYQTMFSAPTFFNKATFGTFAVFSEAVFGMNAEFEQAKFQGDAIFKLPWKSTSEETSKAQMLTHISFSGALFSGAVTFANREFLCAPCFKDGTFQKAPEFHGCIVHDEPIFPARENFHDVTSKNAAQAYRKLKLLMGQFGAHDKASMFYALEQKSRLNQPHTPPSEKVVLFLYQWTADFGESLLRPLAWLAGITGGWWIMYLLLTLGTPFSWKTIGICADFTVEQLVRPLNVWLPTGGTVLKDLIGKNWTLLLTLKFLATFQALTSISLVTLFILSMRRRFKLS